MSKEKWNLELSEYIKQGEPEKQEKAKTWETAIGLQDVDGLKPSEYLLDTAKEHIEGNINIDEAKKRISLDVVIDFAEEDREGLFNHILEDVQKAVPGYEIKMALDSDISD